jgi:hypothetical protein
MSKLASVLERLQKLPLDQQESIAVEIDVLLDDVEHGASLLTDEQWADVEAALADDNEPLASHRDVFARLGVPAAE